MFEEIEKIYKNLDLYLEKENKKNSIYMYKGNKQLKSEIGTEYEKLKQLLISIVNQMKKSKEYLKLKKNRHGNNKIYVNLDSKYRIFGKKYKNKKNILPIELLNRKKEYLSFMGNLDKYFITNKLYFIKIDIKKYYLNIKLDLIKKIITDFSIQKYGKITNSNKKLINILTTNSKNIFVLNSKNLYLGNCISKILEKILYFYILKKLDYTLSVMYVDDILLFYRKDKRINIIQKVFNSIEIIEKIGFDINYSKLEYGIYNMEKLNYLGYEFNSKKIKISEKKVFIKKVKILNIVRKIQINNGVIINTKYIFKKIKNGLYGFYNYYRFCINIIKIMEELFLFAKKSIRFIYKVKTGKSIFKVNSYLNNKKLYCLNIL